MKLKEALKIKEKCDPTDCDCDTCPIGKKVEGEIAQSGVWVRSTICGLLLWIEDFEEVKE